MKINIYYGGRGILDDPTLYVLKKMEEVLEELRVTVERYNIYEHKNEIALLPQTFKDTDAIILATTVEWLGIGGFMQQFLDACWMYADKEKIAQTYMLPVVMSTTYGEREGVLTLENAWEILGGQLCSGLCGYVDDLLAFEMNKEYTLIIEKKAENLYRTISQKIKCLPTSNQAVKRSVLRTQSLDLTPQESEQLSKYVSDDTYVETQKKDIEELASLFRDRMVKSETEEGMEYINDLKSHFNGQQGMQASYYLMIKGKEKGLVIRIDGDELECYYGNDENVDVYGKLSEELMDEITSGRMTFQRAFMTGDMTAKGNFKTLRMLDSFFQFM
ncbi:MAG: SCP2 sterol-binding domain-containing protein [Lachnospiraceae bacterium]|nr:SCP2 sterol-binding domain-containing protein [Lachnospiraceae bacterium]